MAQGIALSGRLLAFAGAQPRIVRQHLTIDHLPRGLVGKQILFITDIHHGRWFSRGAMARLIERLAPLQPDLILLGGDIADNVADEARAISLMASLRAPMGTYCVPGNNDYEAFGGDYARFGRMLAEAGIELLVNERRVMPVDGGRLILTGLDESKYGLPDKRVLAFERRPGDLHILLTHSPWALDRVMDAPAADIALCGHTHGGQIALGPLTPYAIGYERDQLRRRQYFFISGHHVVRSMHILVSNGIGYSLLPIRFGAPPEVHMLSLALPQEKNANL